MGYRRLENDDGKDVATDDGVDIDEPFPVMVFGLSKPIPSNKIGKYLTDSFFYYLNIYKNINRFGLPFDQWTDSPKWLLDMVHWFDDIKNEYEGHKKAKGFV
jgi:hypothetical protein